MRFDEFERLLRQRDLGPVRQQHKIQARCPAHEDKHSSLSIAEGSDGRILVHCHAGCSLESVLLPLGLSMSDLFPDTDRASRSPRRIVAHYPYHDASRKLLYEVVRFQPKDFRPHRPDGKGGWIWNMDGTQPVPYRLPELLAADRDRPVLIPEGESDVDKLRASGLTATCNPFGAEKWKEEYAEHFKGRHVIVLPDNDAPGRKHAEQVARSLYGTATSVKVLELPGLPDKGDVSDWLNQGHTAEELVALASAAPLWQPTTEAQVLKIADSVARYPAAKPAQSIEDVLRAAGFDALGDSPTPDAVETALRRLRELTADADQLRRQSVRGAAIKKLSGLGLGSPAALVDAAIAPRDKQAEDDRGQSTLEADPEPWPEPVVGSELLDSICGLFKRHLVLPEHAADAMALWAVHAHAIDAAYVTPRLVLKSAVKRCGKTNAEILMSIVAPRPWPASNITGAGVFRTIERFHPTLLIDEADSFVTSYEDLRGIIDSGHSRRTAFVTRLVGENHEPKLFSTWAPIVIALIGDLHGTLEDRSIVISMRRKSRSERVERVRGDRLDRHMDLKRKVARWAADNLDRLRDSDPEMPEELNDRAQDNWRALFAIAGAAGDGWLERARSAALALSGEVDEVETTASIRLLADIRDVLLRLGEPRIFSRKLTEELVGIGESPWPGWYRGRPLTEAGLAKLLRLFKIKPKTIWLGHESAKGYEADWFDDPFSRLLPPLQPSDPSEVNADATLDSNSQPSGGSDLTGKK